MTNKELKKMTLEEVKEMCEELECKECKFYSKLRMICKLCEPYQWELEEND